jgi:hypothetical protein
MRSMQCNVEFGYQLNICSGTKENHGTRRSRPLSGEGSVRPNTGTKLATKGQRFRAEGAQGTTASLNQAQSAVTGSDTRLPLLIVWRLLRRDESPARK